MNHVLDLRDRNNNQLTVSTINGPVQVYESTIKDIIAGRISAGCLGAPILVGIITEWIVLRSDIPGCPSRQP